MQMLYVLGALSTIATNKHMPRRPSALRSSNSLPIGPTRLAREIAHKGLKRVGARRPCGAPAGVGVLGREEGPIRRRLKGAAAAIDPKRLERILNTFRHVLNTNQI